MATKKASKKSSKKSSSKKSTRRKSPSKKASAKKSTAKKTSAKSKSSKKSSSRKYSPSVSKNVEREMREMKQGKLKSGRSGKKVTSRKQAIAIGLSEARAEGAKVPRSESFLANYSLKLTFSAKDADGAIPGTIYLRAPDAARSWFAGKFTAREK